MCTACACGTAESVSAVVETGGGSVYQVSGMTCGHCVSSVKEEVGEVAGVTGVDVDLATGLVTVRSESPIEPARIATAVAEAGYEVVAPSLTHRPGWAPTPSDSS